MCAQAHSQWAAQLIELAPAQAAKTFAPLNMQAVLDLLQD
jgi:hypothetical protein